MNIRIDKNGKLLSGIAAVLMLAALIVGCKHNVSTELETFTVTFGSSDNHGTLGATVDGKAIISGSSVQKNKTVVFKATPAANYAVDTWTANGDVVSGSAANTYSHTVTAKIEVRVRFKSSQTSSPGVAVTGVTLNKKELTLEEGGSETLIASVSPKDAANTKISWSSDAIEVVAVTQDGTVKAKKAGTANITVKTDDGDKIDVCAVKVKAKVPQPVQKYKVTFEKTEGGNVTVTPTLLKDGMVNKGTNLTFTATALTGYDLEKWMHNGRVVNGTELSYTFTVNEAANVKVFFKTNGTSIIKRTVTLTQSVHGMVTAEPAIPSDNQIAKDTEITFTARADAGYQVNTWSITDGALQSGGQAGNTTAKVKITADTTVTVTFKSIDYVPVSYADLDMYLKNSASEAHINYIEVTDLTADKLKGNEPSSSELGEILKANKTKEVALKFGDSIAGLTDMSLCFYGCTSLVQAPEIPSKVTDMRFCFLGCIRLEQAPVIPASVTNMEWCFYGCASLVQASQILAKVTNMEGCFYGCTSLVQAPEIPSKVTDMRFCFLGCIRLEQAPVIPASVTNMEWCFYGCASLVQASQILAKVTNMEGCFYGCTSLTQAPEIPASVTNMIGCFYGCTSLTQAPEIPANVTDMEGCFVRCTSLVQAP